jgi:hypothetical protein
MFKDVGLPSIQLALAKKSPPTLLPELLGVAKEALDVLRNPNAIKHQV